MSSYRYSASRGRSNYRNRTSQKRSRQPYPSSRAAAAASASLAQHRWVRPSDDEDNKDDSLVACADKDDNNDVAATELTEPQASTNQPKQKERQQQDEAPILKGPGKLRTTKLFPHRKRPPRPQNRPTSTQPKRIKLATHLVESQCHEATSQQENDDDLEQATKKEATKVEERWTDFAYREGSRHRKRSRYHSHRRGGQNRSLVRVEAKELSQTRICPTFLKGLPCKEPHCLLRHDLPREMAMPACSYFQKNGMCLKQNDVDDPCPFRHVKVNPRATLCPTFHLLGHCSNLNCPMMHTTNNNKSKPKNPHSLIVQNHKLSSGGDVTKDDDHADKGVDLMIYK